ncbi:MAG: hypothetical protein RLZZ253_3386, partial [Verrucomicrobiota bacterium]
SGTLWDLAAGTAWRPLQCCHPPESFRETADLDVRMETLEPLLFVLRQMLLGLVRRVENLWLSVAALELTLRLEDGTACGRRFSLPSASSDPDVLLRVLHTHLEGVRTDRPVTGLVLEVFPSRPPRQQLDLLNRGLRDPNQFFETLDTCPASGHAWSRPRGGTGTGAHPPARPVHTGYPQPPAAGHGLNPWPPAAPSSCIPVGSPGGSLERSRRCRVGLSGTPGIRCHRPATCPARHGAAPVPAPGPGRGPGGSRQSPARGAPERGCGGPGDGAARSVVRVGRLVDRPRMEPPGMGCAAFGRAALPDLRGERGMAAGRHLRLRRRMEYVELHASSALSFLRASSPPETLAATAAERGLKAMALCDRQGVYGIPRFHRAAAEHGIRPLTGCELEMEDDSVLPVLVASSTGYRNLCRLLSRSHLAAPKGKARIPWQALEGSTEGLVALTGGPDGPLRSALRVAGPDSARDRLRHLREMFGSGHLGVELQRHRLRGEEREVSVLVGLARELEVPVVATNGVLYARPSGRRILDVFTCLRAHQTLDEAGTRLSPNSQRHLKTGVQMAALFPDLPEAIANTRQIAERLEFTLQDLGYQFPDYSPPGGTDQKAYLSRVTLEGARTRYGAQVPEAVRRQLAHELDLIHRLGFEGYFLMVWDIVNFCRSEGILVQGRGSAANSAVCYCLGITAVDAVQCNLLFERFLSEGRRSWPDIDLDLPSGSRRERVIQEIYRRHGREGAAMTANVITYRGRSAARELGRVLCLPPDLVERFMQIQAQDGPGGAGARQFQHPRFPVFLKLYEELQGLPRHLGQHSGGMILSTGNLSSVVPLENASMPGRSVAQWDKEDCAYMGLVKFDLLGLGMLGAINQVFVEIDRRFGERWELGTVPREEPTVYDTMCRADVIGVFQIESRAQRVQMRCTPVPQSGG